MIVDPRIQLRFDFARHGTRPFFQKSGPTAAAEAQRQALALGWLCVQSVARGKQLLAITPAGVEAINEVMTVSADRAPSSRPSRSGGRKPAPRPTPLKAPKPAASLPVHRIPPMDSEILDNVLRDIYLGKMSATEGQLALMAAGFPAALAQQEIELFLAD